MFFIQFDLTGDFSGVFFIEFGLVGDFSGVFFIFFGLAGDFSGVTEISFDSTPIISFSMLSNSAHSILLSCSLGSTLIFIKKLIYYNQ